MAHALCQVLEHGGSLQSFYVGVPGAGALDALFLMPLVMAAVIAYAALGCGVTASYCRRSSAASSAR